MRIQTVKSSTKILLSHIGRVVKIHTGKAWVNLLVLEGMEEHFFGEYILTKKLGGSIHKIKIKKKQRKKK